MDEILRDLNAAFKAISTIAVSGDAVDAMAVARTKLRKVYADLEKYSMEEKAELEE